MNEKLLCRCTGSIVANNVANALDVNSIKYRMHDETADQRNGAYGPNPGIEETGDYTLALSIENNGFNGTNKVSENI